MTRGCSVEPTAEFLAVAQDMAVVESITNVSDPFSPAAPVNIQTYFHVLASSEAESDVYIARSVMEEQLAVINADFAPSDIQFTLAGVDWTINADWAVDGAPLAMKKELRKGDYKALNVYFHDTLRALGVRLIP